MKKQKRIKKDNEKLMLRSEMNKSDEKVESEQQKTAPSKPFQEKTVQKPIQKLEPKKLRKLKHDKKKKNQPKKELPVEDDRDREPSFREIFKMMFNRKKKKKTYELPDVIKRVKRVKPDYNVGLSNDLVEERFEKGQVNIAPNKNTKTIGSIIIENVFTFFNILCFLVAIGLAIVDIRYQQKWSNLLFMVIILVNIAIGIIQEIRAKKTIEKLSLLTAPVVKVVRDGVESNISVEEVVLDDIVVLSTGKQIVADCIIVEGNIEVNESVLTGESLPIKKKVGDTLLAGSFVVSGKCHARVDKVGANTFLSQLAASAKKYRKPRSELFSSLKIIIKVIGLLIIPIAVLLYIKSMQITGDIVSAITTTAGATIGMIPAGMFLLCSVSLTVSVIKLAKKKALVQDLYCVEMLARVNVLCLDKTGTITDGTMKVFNCLQLESTNQTIKRIVGSMLSALGDNNQTSQALINYFGYNKDMKPLATLPFSSSRKLSAVTFEDEGPFIMGAPEFVLPGMNDEKLKKMVEQYAKDGYRTLLLAHSSKSITGDTLPETRTPVSLIILEDHIRDDAAKTIAWFKENGVAVKIISGDNPLTVSEIAKRVGVENTDAFISLDGLNEKQVMAAASRYTVFGRVTPEQKALLIKTMRSEGNTVAMTGDGVNDILALKEADCSIAMASGNEAVRSVSHMVLLNSDFSSMPDTVLEGRKVINNVQKASSLFFMKTLFSIFFSVLVVAIPNMFYPFTTARMLLFEWFVVGIPSFILAFMPNNKPIQGKFIYNLIKNALPGALTLVMNVGAVYLFNLLVSGTFIGEEIVQTISTMSAIVLIFTGLAMLFRLCKPFNAVTTILFISMITLCALCIIYWPGFFELISVSSLALQDVLFIIILAIASPTIIGIFYKLMDMVSF